MRNLFHGKYEKKIYITFLTVFSLLVFTFMLFFTAKLYSRTLAEQKQTILHGMELDWSSSQLKVELVLKEQERVMESVSALNFASAETANFTYFHSVKLQKELQIATNRMNGLDSIIAIMTLDNSDFIITPTSSESMELFFSQTLPMEKATVDVMFEELKRGAKSYTTMTQGEVPIIVHAVQKSMGSESLISIIGIEQRDFLLPSSNYEWYMTNNKGVFAWSSGNNTENFGEIYNIFQNNQRKEFFDYKENTIYVYPINSVGWSLLIEYPDTKIAWYSIAMEMFLPYSIAILVALLSAWLVSRILYQPMGELMQEVSERIGLYDEFSLLKKNSGRVKELNERLQAAVVERDLLLRHRQNRDLLFGVKSSLYETKEPDIIQSYSVALIEFRNDLFDEMEDFRLYKDHIADYVHNHDKLFYANLAGSLCAVIIESSSYEESQSFIQELLNAMVLESGDQVQVALSGLREGQQQIHTSYMECKKILEYRFLFRTQVLLTMAQVEEIEQTSCYYPLRVENQLIHYAVQGDMRLMSLYKSILDENGGEFNLSPESRKMLVLSLGGTLHRIVQELKAPPEQIFDTVDALTLANRWNHGGVFTEISLALSKIYQYVTGEKARQDSEVSTTMLEFIHTNYNQDIMLIDLAEELNVTEKYCGILFKQRTGENFKTYLNQYRIRRAQEILKSEPTCKVAELAHQVGFNSSNTFIRVFSKLVGTTPKQYAEDISSRQ